MPARFEKLSDLRHAFVRALLFKVVDIQEPNRRNRQDVWIRLICTLLYVEEGNKLAIIVERRFAAQLLLAPRNIDAYVPALVEEEIEALSHVEAEACTALIEMARRPRIVLSDIFSSTTTMASYSS